MTFYDFHGFSSQISVFLHTVLPNVQAMTNPASVDTGHGRPMTPEEAQEFFKQAFDNRPIHAILKELDDNP